MHSTCFDLWCILIERLRVYEAYNRILEGGLKLSSFRLPLRAFSAVFSTRVSKSIFMSINLFIYENEKRKQKEVEKWRKII